MKQLFSAFIIGIIVCFFAVKSCDDKPKQVNVKEIKKEIKASGNLAETVNHEYQKAKQEFSKVADSLKTENQKLNVKLQVTRALLKKQQTVRLQFPFQEKQAQEKNWWRKRFIIIATEKNLHL